MIFSPQQALFLFSECGVDVPVISIGHIVTRMDENATIEQKLFALLKGKREKTIFVLTGMSGIGKSRLIQLICESGKSNTTTFGLDTCIGTPAGSEERLQLTLNGADHFWKYFYNEEILSQFLGKILQAQPGTEISLQSGYLRDGESNVLQLPQDHKHCIWEGVRAFQYTQDISSDAHEYSPYQLSYHFLLSHPIAQFLRVIMRDFEDGKMGTIDPKKLNERLLFRCREQMYQILAMGAELRLQPHAYIHDYQYIDALSVEKMKKLLECSENKTDFKLLLEQLIQISTTQQEFFQQISNLDPAHIYAFEYFIDQLAHFLKGEIGSKRNQIAM